ncbi:bifunctional (p)ppGpp synthetase/guanosine-3',5'-bis(diphosphate) 3'-pyrophosphohydrolase [Bacillus sp. HMF5848]|uniref:HD domain-containing protein n=1 Tax=Bacillus sp. HMF5848 TaxID=2495421 RepID=UPI000F7788A3|nr:HD domain-containing protein [Bacillus sp. HMF5848]RSK26747.1 bifunctional (p)ppGpp synthetase/guanosine-3',5'-bis(diphosphate) 3'-pyrophosphohydrolase [Bacillus sp. HMF5848]
MLQSALIDKAVRYAAKAHEGQYRKTEKVSYITHPFTVALYVFDALVETDFSPATKEAIVIAALLHDVWEDTEISLDDIRNEFGEQVAKLVYGASEPDKSQTWKSRKQHTIDSLRLAPLEVKYIVCADKTHNITSLLNDYEKHGDNIWRSFKGTKEEQHWYYSEIAKSLQTGVLNTPKFFTKYEELVNNLFVK